MDVETFPHPIDMTCLRRGSVVTPQEIREIWGNEPGSKKFGLDQLRLKKLIRTHFRRKRGDIVSVVSRGDSVVVLGHQEQDEYVARWKIRALEMFKHRHGEDMATDDAVLTYEQRVAKDRRVVRDGWLILQFARQCPPGVTSVPAEIDSLV